MRELSGAPRSGESQETALDRIERILRVQVELMTEIRDHMHSQSARRPHPRDSDSVFLEAIETRIHGLTCRARDLIERANIDEEFRVLLVERNILRGADSESAVILGRHLSAIHKRTQAGLGPYRLSRIKRDGQSVLWTIETAW